MAAPSPSPSACPLCLNAPTLGDTLWPTTSEHGEAFTLRLCPACGSGYLDPAPTPAQLAHAYSTAYYGAGDTKFPSLIERFRRACAGVLARKLLRRLPASPTVLDVGCGDGGFLCQLQAAGAGPCHGIEPPGDAADRAASTPGLTLHRSTLATADLPPAGFDLVSARHVFEHLPEPLASLDQMAALVRPGGLLFLSYPNIRSWQARWFRGAWFHLDAPRHLHLANPEIVVKHLGNASLELIETGHWSLEQNLYGWLQSVLNRFDTRRNFLYERIKGNRAHLAERGAPHLALHLVAAALLLPPLFFLDVFSVLARRGATVQLTFRRTR
jgi:SAM-dependent methyltransferase